MAHNVFISYASQDKAIADAVCATLESNQVRCWIAPRDILPGVPYTEALTEALRACRIVVLVLSAASNGSKHVMREVDAAVAAGIPVVPFRIGEMSLSMSMNYLLKSIHWLDALSPPMEQHLQTLTEVVQNLIARAQPSISAAMRGTDPAICLPHGGASSSQGPSSHQWQVPPSGQWRVAPTSQWRGVPAQQLPAAPARLWLTGPARLWWIVAAVLLGAMALWC